MAELPLLDRGGLRALLEQGLEPGNGPVVPLWENHLLRAAWPAESQADWSPLELFQRHFVLFATLYELADEYAAHGAYLHVHFMRTKLCRRPPLGTCLHYDAYAGRFCAASLPCRFHPEGDLPTLADSRGFYRDPANINWMDAADAEKVLGGAWKLLAAWPKAEAAWRTLGLSPGNSLAVVKQRFRELAKQQHPDVTASRTGIGQHNAGPDFHQVREAYELLVGLLD